VVEIQVRDFLTGWYAQQCSYQGARWYSSHTRIEDVPASEGAGRVRADVKVIASKVQAAMRGHKAPVCAFEFTAPVQMCW
jgi:hypothetical protein